MVSFMEKVCLLVRFQLLVSLPLIQSAENCVGWFVFITAEHAEEKNRSKEEGRETEGASAWYKKC